MRPRARPRCRPWLLRWRRWLHQVPRRLRYHPWLPQLSRPPPTFAPSLVPGEKAAPATAPTGAPPAVPTAGAPNACVCVWVCVCPPLVAPRRAPPAAAEAEAGASRLEAESAEVMASEPGIINSSSMLTFQPTVEGKDGFRVPVSWASQASLTPPGLMIASA